LTKIHHFKASRLKTVEIGYNVDSPLTSFVHALDPGGIPWEGPSSYASLDAAFQDLDDGLAEVLLDLLRGITLQAKLRIGFFKILPV
jgi:hypothetical protein